MTNLKMSDVQLKKKKHRVRERKKKRHFYIHSRPDMILGQKTSQETKSFFKVKKLCEQFENEDIYSSK